MDLGVACVCVRYFKEGLVIIMTKKAFFFVCKSLGKVASIVSMYFLAMS